MNDPLDLPLRDIHLPESVGIWPLAYGWWILLFILVAVIVAGIFLYLRNRRNRFSAITLARKELEEIQEKFSRDNNPEQLVREVSILIRRLAISLFPRTDVAHLTGDSWLAFLDQQVEGEPFSSGDGRILVDAPYRKEFVSEDIESIVRNCSQWIDAVARRQKL
jgi:hypothetical protein